VKGQSYAFSNHHYIKKYPWGRVMGRARVYSIVDGDLPEGCRYVKIYLGFKGTGIMQIFILRFWSGYLAGLQSSGRSHGSGALVSICS